MKVETIKVDQVPGTERESIVEQTPALAALLESLGRANAPDATKIALTSPEEKKAAPSIAGALRRRINAREFPFRVRVRPDALYITRKKAK